MPRRSLVIVLLLVATVMSGCKRARQKELERRAAETMGADKAELSEDGGRLVITDKSGSHQSELEIGAQAQIPADFPKSIPIYPGAKILAAVGTTEDGDRSQMVTLLAPAEARVVHDFYKARLAALGHVQEIAVAGVRILSVEPDGGASVSVTVNGTGPNESTIQLSATPRDAH